MINNPLVDDIIKESDTPYDALERIVVVVNSNDDSKELQDLKTKTVEIINKVAQKSDALGIIKLGSLYYVKHQDDNIIMSKNVDNATHYSETKAHQIIKDLNSGIFVTNQQLERENSYGQKHVSLS